MSTRVGVKEHLEQITRSMEEKAAENAAARKDRQRGTGSTAAPLGLALFQDQYKALEKKVEELNARTDVLRMIELSQLDDSPFQPNSLSESRVQRLVDHLKHNPWGAPIMVRVRPDGRFETITGHHRREAARRLGWNEIEATVKDLSDDHAQRLVLYDNLMSPELHAFDWYVALAARAKAGNLTQQQLANEASISQSFVSRLFQAFDSLPAEALNELKKKASALPIEHAKTLSELAKKDAATVIDAIKKLVAEEFKRPADAVRFVEDKIDPKTHQKLERVMMMDGRKTWATITPREGQLTVRLTQAPELIDQLQQKIFSFLKELKELKDK